MRLFGLPWIIGSFIGAVTVTFFWPPVATIPFWVWVFTLFGINIATVLTFEMILYAILGPSK